MDPPPTDPPGAPPPPPLIDPPPNRPSLNPPPIPPPPPQGASGQQLVGGVVGIQNRGVAPPPPRAVSVCTANAARTRVRAGSKQLTLSCNASRHVEQRYESRYGEMAWAGSPGQP